MMDVRDKERSSWSVLTPSIAQKQQHYSNLERFLQCATPSPPSKFLPQSCIHDLNSLWQPPGSKDIVEYFTLGDLWGCYDEWSAYGAGTQVVLSCGETIMQYYVPYLSAILIYSNKSVVASSREVELPCFSSCRNSREYNDVVVQFESDCWSDDSMSDHKLSRSLSNNSSKTWDTISEDSSVDHEGSLSMRDKLGYLHFQYFEISSPYWRVPLMEKVTELARNNPGLITLKNVDLSPANALCSTSQAVDRLSFFFQAVDRFTWAVLESTLDFNRMAVAWYPIYHIPSQGNDKDLSTCFLTYHTLSSSFQDCVNGDEDIEANGTGSKRKGEGIGDISLPPFGLATYKMQGDLWINPETSDDERMIYLESAAGSWLKQLNRSLSNMRTPSYIGEVICTDLNLGNLPPYIHGIRVLPTHMNEVWAWEVDIEYCGGLVLDIETRLEVRELDSQKGVVNTDSGPSSVRDACQDLLEGFEHHGKQLNFSEGTVDSREWRDEGNPKSDKSKDSRSGISSSTNVSRWKSIFNSVAKQVSQVPLSLSIRVGSLRGTVRLHIKPPPSDQLWFGFTSTPDVEFELESSVGERKITSGQVALYLINKFKAAIRETMVLPNCESVCIPWMLAEKNDWVPQNVAPFIWINQEAATDNATALELLNSQLDAKTKIEAGRGTSYDYPESKHKKTRNAENVEPSFSDSSDASARASSSSKPSMKNDKSLQDLTSPLLANSETQESGQNSSGYVSESQSSSRSLTSLEQQAHAAEEADSRPKKMGRRAKMLDLGKKMGEKFEEQRRHIEEKGRDIVDKMRGP